MKYVQEAFAANWIAPVGPHLEAFEQSICTFTGSSNAVALSSGTAALHLALLNLGVSPGDEVLCQSFTFAASANAWALRTSGRPVSSSNCQRVPARTR